MKRHLRTPHIRAAFPRSVVASAVLVVSGVACGGNSGNGDIVSGTDRLDIDCSAQKNFELPRCVTLRIEISESLRTDQFGYLKRAEKVAIVREAVKSPIPEDRAEAEPGETLRLIDLNSGEVIKEGEPEPWEGGAEDPGSGDAIAWFDFSEIEREGEYVIIDVDRNLRSNPFRIGDEVFDDVLKAALRTFFYQRAGFEKDARYAGEAWADGASHLGPEQDGGARFYKTPNDGNSARDLRGGWYDAGDYNKYTNWHCSYLQELLATYEETPGLWDDEANIPESGNGVPDLLDEIHFGLDYLERLQNEDGSVLAIVDLGSASPPSAATEWSLYGPASTSATLSAAAAFAHAALVFEDVDAFKEDVAALRKRAEDAYRWADQNPNQIYFNRAEDGSTRDGGNNAIGAGEQEVDDRERLIKKLSASVFLLELTGDESYRSFFDSNYASANFEMLTNNFVQPFDFIWQDMLLRYAALPEASDAIASSIREAYASSMEGDHQLKALRDGIDGYRSYIKDYTWGSNAVKARQGLMFAQLQKHEVSPSDIGAIERSAWGYAHYLHGANPFGLVYLSNMSFLGAERSVTTFYHAWFEEGSERWSKVTDTTAGPAPGFLVGGPNPQYSVNECCPNNCFGEENNARCDLSFQDRIASSPPTKAYAETNEGWPLDSWKLTENSNGYQVAYIRLLANLIAATR